MLAAERTFSLTFSNFDLLKQKRRRTTKAAAHVKRRRRERKERERERERLFTLFRVHNRIICRRLLRVCLYFARSSGLLFQRPTHVHTHTTIAPFYIKAWVSLSLSVVAWMWDSTRSPPTTRAFFFSSTFLTSHFVIAVVTFCCYCCTESLLMLWGADDPHLADGSPSNLPVVTV